MSFDGLTHAADGEATLSVPEVVAHMMQLIVAGTDTTASLITSLLCELLTDRTRWERLLADRSLVIAVIEESLRHDSPLPYVLRTVREGGRLTAARYPPGTGSCSACSPPTGTRMPGDPTPAGSSSTARPGRQRTWPGARVHATFRKVTDSYQTEDGCELRSGDDCALGGLRLGQFAVERGAADPEPCGDFASRASAFRVSH